MKKVYILISFIFLLACGIRLKSAKKIFKANPVTIFTNIDNAIASNKKALLFIVFNDGDIEAYNSPITKILKFDTIKADVLCYEVLASDYAVLKLYNSEFRALLNNLDESHKTEALEYNPNKTFVFISSPSKTFALYGKRTIDVPKAEIHDLIWVGFGP